MTRPTSELVGEGAAAARRRSLGRIRRLAIGVLALALPGAWGCERGESARQAPPATNPATANAPFTPDQIQVVLKTLTEASNQGFAPDAFGNARQIAALAASIDPAEQARGQGLLRAAIVAYARAQHGLGLRTADFPKEWDIRPPPYDADLELRAALAQDRLSQWLKSLPPPSPDYLALVQALAIYEKIADLGGWAPVPPGAPMRQGDSDPRVANLRNRLAFENPAVASLPRDAVYDGELTQAVMRFQARYGLQPTGVVGPETYQALNAPAPARVNQIRANLQRWRWAPRDPPATRIEVDTASGTLDYYKDGRPAMHMLAVAGKPDDQSPMLVSKVTDVVFNPSWKVPADIAVKELFPKQRRNHGYFRREGFVRGTSAAAPLVQKPGPKNALGQVKFEFDNAFGVYMHDTPAKSAFALAQRSVSHGCIRLQYAVDLAKALLSSNPGWSPERVDQTIASADTQTAALAEPVPVFLLYWTAYVRDGQVALRQDPYGWDDQLVRLLDASPSHRG